MFQLVVNIPFIKKNVFFFNRRVAAISLAKRVALETQTEPGGLVGYRFNKTLRVLHLIFFFISIMHRNVHED